MNKVFILLWMFFMHIVDDFYLQPGLLSKMKQKSWWEQNAPDKMYRYDYIWALFAHSFSWAFMIMLPVAYYFNFNINYKFFILFVINAVVHAMVDNWKANDKLINLWQDQLIHSFQIILTATLIFGI